ncbi:MAG: geranylgeranylglycerol-phosphate geranylgeranyltransferase [bacterium]|nr:MAG: geranylgeranylglycerol-phosphate geranylgeranyltransferase [bacterium]
MKVFLYCIAIVRPHNIAAALLSTGVGFSLASPGNWPWMLLGVVALVTAAGNVINDIYDVDIDRINKPKRPLPSGILSVRLATVLYVAFLCILVVSIFHLPRLQAAWIVIWAVMLHLYSARLKRIFLAGNVFVSIVSASAFLLGALAGGRIASGLLPACFTFFFVLGREFVKDCEDLEGDRMCGARTVPVVSGKGRALTFAAVIFGLLIVGFPIPYAVGYYGAGYGLLMIFGVIPILVASIVLTLTARSPSHVSLLLKIGMFFGIVAFYLGVRRP